MINVIRYYRKTLNENEAANIFEGILIKYNVITAKTSKEGIQKIKVYSQLPIFQFLLSAETIELADAIKFLLVKVETKDFNKIDVLFSRIEHLLGIETSPIW